MKALIIPESASEDFERVYKQVEQRRNKLYNEKYNSTRPREYDGSHIIQMVSIWFSDIFPCHVRQYGFSDLPCGKRFGKSA